MVLIFSFFSFFYTTLIESDTHRIIRLWKLTKYYEYRILWIQNTMNTKYYEYRILWIQNTMNTEYYEYRILWQKYDKNKYRNKVEMTSMNIHNYLLLTVKLFFYLRQTSITVFNRLLSWHHNISLRTDITNHNTLLSEPTSDIKVVLLNTNYNIMNETLWRQYRLHRISVLTMSR